MRHSNKVLARFTFKVILLLSIFSLATPNCTFAQDKPQAVEVKMKDGSIIIGELIEQTTEKLVVKTSTMGEVTILKSNMTGYRRLRSTNMVNGVYWHENPNPTRNVYGPTGYGLRKGEGYYQNFMIFLNQVSYGFTDHFTVGVGVEILSILAGFNGDGGFPGFTITPKFSIPIKENEWNLGVGALALHVPSGEDLFSAGIAYGVSTWGSRDNNVTVGLGFGTIEGDFSGRPIVTFSGNLRTGRRFGLVTENWFYAQDGSLLAFFSLGGRYIGERITWDLTIVGAILDGYGGVSPIPLVGIAIPFGAGWNN